MELFSIKNSLHVNGGSMLTAASPPPCTSRMKDYLLTQEEYQVVETPALLSPPSHHPPVLAQCLPAGLQDSLMVTVLTLDFAALMVAVTPVGKQRPRSNLYLK